MTNLQLLSRLLEVLDAREWSRTRVGRTFYVYQPQNSDFELFVPKDAGAPGFARAFDVSLEALASYYGVPFHSLEGVLTPATEILSVRLMGSSYAGGVAPLPRFERVLEHLKLAITKAVAYVVTDDPASPKVTAKMRRFLDDCWFMQTERGSFVARVAMPVEGDLAEPSLFATSPKRAEVVSALRATGELIGERVLRNDDDVFSEEGFEEIRPSLSVGVVEEMARLMKGSAADAIELGFSHQDSTDTIRLAELSVERLARLDRFISYARERVRETFDLTFDGIVFENRRSRRSRERGGMVSLTGTLDGHSQVVSLRLRPDQMSQFAAYYLDKQLIRVRGRARRLRTYIKLDHLSSVDEL